MSRRLAAAASLLLLALAVTVALVLAIQSFPRGAAVLACLVAAVGAGWWALLRRGGRSRGGARFPHYTCRPHCPPAGPVTA